jgi:hypothetical protein
MVHSFGGKWATKFKEAIEKQRAAKKEKKEKRTLIRGKKKAARKDSRENVKKVREQFKDDAKKRRGAVGGVKAFHKTDKEGNKGGWAATGAYSKKTSDRAKRQEERKAKRKAVRTGGGLTPEKDEVGSEIKR